MLYSSEKRIKLQIKVSKNLNQIAKETSASASAKFCVIGCTKLAALALALVNFQSSAKVAALVKKVALIAALVKVAALVPTTVSTVALP